MADVKIIATALLALLCACARPQTDPSASPAPIPAEGLSLAPKPVPLDSPDPAALERAKRAKVCGGDFTTVADDIGGKIFVGCAQGEVFVLDRDMRKLRSAGTQMRVDSIMPAGSNAVAVYGTVDGASLRSMLTLLDAQTLRPLMQQGFTDSTYLGVYRGRAYIDDWCCNGRADTYAPATIYSVSLKDGTESEHVDLAPDPQEHPARFAPIGQGESNYRIGKYFYVHVEEITYRYDLTDLKQPPVRMRSSLPWGPGSRP
jgi:hypothetical protein